MNKIDRTPGFRERRVKEVTWALMSMVERYEVARNFFYAGAGPGANEYLHAITQAVDWVQSGKPDPTL